MEPGSVIVGVEYTQPDRGDPGWAVVASYVGVTIENAPPGVPRFVTSGDPEADWNQAWELLAPWVFGFAIDTSHTVERFVRDSDGWFAFDDDGMLVRSCEAPGAIRVAAA